MNKTEIEAAIRSRGIHAVQLAPLDGSQSRSKLGGLPDVPHGFVWPAWNEKPLAFIAQIELAAVPITDTLKGLPTRGMLYFFYDRDQSTWGYDPKHRGSWRVIYCADDSTLSEADLPYELDANYLYSERRVVPRKIMSYPSPERLGGEVGDLFEAAFDLEEELRSESFQGGAEHQLGGFPNAIQGDQMELEAQLVFNGISCGDGSGYADPRADELRPGAADWQLLLQVDEDENCGMQWGDGGRLYFWIRRQDLAHQDFSNVWMILQCF